MEGLGFCTSRLGTAIEVPLLVMQAGVLAGMGWSSQLVEVMGEQGRLGAICLKSVSGGGALLRPAMLGVPVMAMRWTRASPEVPAKKVELSVLTTPATGAKGAGADGAVASGMSVSLPGVRVGVRDVLEMVPVAFFIEAKKPGDGPTPRQENFANERKEKQNAITFVIDEDPSIGKGNGLDKLTEWLEEIEKSNERIRPAFTR